MRFLKVSMLSGIAVAVRMATALVLNKILALAVGPGGYAVIGQFQNAMAVATTLGSGATAQGVTRYTAEHRDDPASQHRVWQTAGSLTLIGSALAALIIIPASGWLAARLLFDPGAWPVFVALALGLVALGGNGLLLAILNGQEDTQAYVAANIAGSLLGLALAGGLALWFGLRGALFALALNQSVALLATAWLVRDRPWVRWRNLVGTIEPEALRNLGRYALMASVAALATPLSQIVIRDLLIARFGLAEAGYFDAMMRISGLYLAFFTSTMAIYYLPRIARLPENAALRAEVASIVRIVAPAVALLSLSIWLLREFLVRLLFAADFLPMTELFAAQMIGDVLKIVSWIYAYVMIGRGLTTAFIATEIGFSLSLVALIALATRTWGIEGASIGYAINYGAYLVVVLLIYRRAVAAA